MTVKFDFKSAFACEDIRQETTGNVSFMGVVTDGEFMFSVFPARVRLGVVVVCDVEGTGPATLYTRLRLGGEIKWAGETEVEVDAEGTGILIPVAHIFAQFDEPGRLELLIGVDEDDDSSAQLVKFWDVLAAEAPHHSSESSTPSDGAR